MAQLKIMGTRGDESITWDPNNEEEVEQAQQKFTELREAGYNIYAGERVDEFDPTLGELIAVPPMAGG